MSEQSRSDTHANFHATYTHMNYLKISIIQSIQVTLHTLINTYMYVCWYIYIYIYIYIYMYIYTPTHMHISKATHMHIHQTSGPSHGADCMMFESLTSEVSSLEEALADSHSQIQGIYACLYICVWIYVFMYVYMYLYMLVCSLENPLLTCTSQSVAHMHITIQGIY
jgi:hypothetical protein